MVKRVTPAEKARLYLAEWREKRDLTQEKLAEEAGTTKATISRWEAGERDPPFAALCALAAVLGVHVSNLFLDPETPSIDAELAMLPEPVSKRLIERFNDTIAGAKAIGKTSGE